MQYSQEDRYHERKRIQRLRKSAHNIYFKEFNQHLMISPTCYFNRESDYSGDICLLKEGRPLHYSAQFLFEIQTYNIFENSYYPGSDMRSYFRPTPPLEKWKSSYDSIMASTALLYYNGVYTLPKFGCITKEDIENCTKHFFREKLDCWFCWNVTAKISYLVRDNGGNWIEEDKKENDKNEKDLE